MQRQIKASLNKNCTSFPPGTITDGDGNVVTLADMNRQNINPIPQIQKLDSVHDFGGTRGNNLATDAITKSRVNGEFTYDQMRLSFIQKYSFNNPALAVRIPDINIQGYSYFSSPGIGNLARIVDDVENFVLLSVLQEATTTTGYTVANDNFLCRPIPKSTDPNSTQSFTATKTALAAFFASYNDTGTGKINFIVDTPGDLTKVLKSDTTQDNFAYILTQESAHDSAKSKPTTLSPIVIDSAYNGNGFCEAFTDQTRTYAFNAENTPGNFESNFTITFTGMKYTAAAGGKENFSTDVQYTKPGFSQNVPCPLNGLVHPTNVPQITKAVANITKNSILNLVNRDKLILETHAANYINNFYTNFINPTNRYNYSDPSQNLLDFNFTKKRAGDGLQARICQYVNSGNIQLQCYRRRQSRDPAGNVTAGLYTARVYNITRLILVTIDRVLFSYCVKNGIPAIYSGTDFFIFFKPNPTTVFRQGRGGSMPLLGQPMKTYSKKSARNQISKKGSSIIQKGGDMTAFFNEINEIPYIIFKLLPHILTSLIGPRRPITTNIIPINNFIAECKGLNDEQLITQYGNGRVFLTKLNDLKIPVFETDQTIEPRIIWFEDTKYLNKRPDAYDLVLPGVRETINILAGQITGILDNDSNSIFTRSRAEAFIQANLRNLTPVEPVTNEELDVVTAGSILSYFSPTEGRELGDRELVGGANKNLLDMYIDLQVNNPNKCDKNTLELTNFASILSYFFIFSNYEVSFCYDNDIYEQKFINENGLEVTKTIGLYIMYDLLLNDFLQQKSKISYSLLEYFINSGDTTQKYLSISTDMMETLQYVYCDDIRLDQSLDKKIEEQIQNQTISTSDPIFIESQTYYNTLYDRIAAKQREVQAYLDGTNTDPNIGNYIKNNLSMYGFMNMTNDFLDSLSPAQSSSSSQGVARGVQPQNLAYPTGEERRQQIESQRTRSPSAQIPSKPQQQRKTGVYTLSDFPKPKGEEVGQTVPVYAKSIGGKYRTNKTNRKNRKTRKNRKIIKKNRNIRKTKKQINKRTRRN
jgi:hypothetical protein